MLPTVANKTLAKIRPKLLKFISSPVKSTTHVVRENPLQTALALGLLMGVKARIATGRFQAVKGDSAYVEDPITHTFKENDGENSMVNGAIEYNTNVDMEPEYYSKVAAAGGTGSALRSGITEFKTQMGAGVGADAARGAKSRMGTPGSLGYLAGAGLLLGADILTSPESQETVADAIHTVKRLTGNDGMSNTTKMLLAAGGAGALGLGGAAAYQIHKQNQENDDFDRINGYGEYYHTGPVSTKQVNSAGVGDSGGFEN